MKNLLLSKSHCITGCMAFHAISPMIFIDDHLGHFIFFLSKTLISLMVQSFPF